jgi:C-terminal processing protease CtpA/Prc
VDMIAAQFVSGPVASIRGRDGTSTWDLPDGQLRSQLADTLVTVLIDGRTTGSPEVLAGLLARDDRVWTIGSRTAGLVRHAEPIDLPGGRLLFLVTQETIGSDGSPITPVWPDRSIDAEWLDQAESEDTGILAALESFGGYGVSSASPDFQLIPLACAGHACPER